ncbi:MAG: hypothetical protein F6K47_08870 [Symploca sp. SIO2E6]|nr:hypothetical protein [Symploca sp. SIO2E6]
MGIGNWELGIGNWELGIGNWGSLSVSLNSLIQIPDFFKKSGISTPCDRSCFLLLSLIIEKVCTCRYSKF